MNIWEPRYPLIASSVKPVLVNLVSQDVLHGFYLPAFRVKRDVVPRMKNYAWFVAERPGSYDLFCSVYCGTGHSVMITTVEALPPAKFDAWLSEKGGPEHAGMELLKSTAAWVATASTARRRSVCLLRVSGAAQLWS